MKKLIFGLAATLATIPAFVHSENLVEWESLGNTSHGNYIQRFRINSEVPFDRLAFCEFKSDMNPVDPSDSIIEILPGYYAVGSDRFVDTEATDTLIVDILTSGYLIHSAQLPDGIHLVKDGKPIKCLSVVNKPIAFQSQWQSNDHDPMIYGDKAFEINDALRTTYRPTPYRQIPTPKRVSTTGAKIILPPDIELIEVEDDRNDYYKAEIKAEGIRIFTNSKFPDSLKERVLKRIIRETDAESGIPEGTIEDWADLQYRGLMIDVARSFLGKEDLKSLLDLMDDYDLNVLHLHAGDDEGWRIEIPSLPELIELGSKRGYTETDEAPYLKQIYSGDGDPESRNSSNGYYSVEDFKELLQYANSKGIAIIPEFDSPGHSRAAIRAMEHRSRLTGDSSLRLIHDGDTSRYSTAQFFTDNLMNPALEGPYKFWGIVFDDLKRIYSDADVKLEAIHIGGDEVPEHAWDGSIAARHLMDSLNLSTQRELHAYFVSRVAKAAAERDIKIAGWQEVALDHTEEYNAAVRPQIYSVNCWTSSDGKGAEIASNDFPVVISNVDYLYFDHIYSSHPEDPGMWWGGIVDEFSPLHATAEALCPVDQDHRNNVKGISAHLFAETLRNRSMAERYLLPRILGLAERAHNSEATISDEDYFGCITAEMKKWQQEDRNFYLRQPGIQLKDGKILMNEPYGFGEIRYTIDCSDPTSASPRYLSPIDATQIPVSKNGHREVRARLFAQPAVSAVSILYVD